ncbi:hypothetical protein FACS18949_02750 [Clostridia bacterium]|nr:hypothetical protein FACS189425_10190 [Clostridia bacterium]GHV32295.1 hypothetical protein FACS18949_02750 [Clostridia bacterium]
MAKTDGAGGSSGTPPSGNKKRYNSHAMAVILDLSERRVRQLRDEGILKEDNSTGALSVLTIIDRLRLAFERRGIIAEQYQLMPPLEWVIYPEDTAPYFLGEISTVWTIPAVQQEVNFNG